VFMTNLLFPKLYAPLFMCIYTQYIFKTLNVNVIYLNALILNHFVPHGG
jgi:hypothetical protein